MYVYVGGGLPVNPRPPFNYFTTWSISDNINQFNQPTTVVRGGKEMVIPALSEVMHFEIEEFKNLECFTSNGLGGRAGDGSFHRSLARPRRADALPQRA